MKIQIDRDMKIALLKSFKQGFIETDDIPGFPKIPLPTEQMTKEEILKELEQIHKGMSC